MKKTELITAVFKRTGIPLEHVRVAIENALHLIRATVESGEVVQITDFGTFGIRYHASRSCMNVSKNIPMIAPARFSVMFKPGDNFKANVKKLDATDPVMIDRSYPKYSEYVKKNNKERREAAREKKRKLMEGDSGAAS